jgi:hypothetical protein
MKLPIFDLIIDEGPDSEFEVNFVSMVDKPAIKANWLAFKDVVKFAANDEERTIVGPALIPDMLILRQDDRIGQYYVKFSREEIKKIAVKFFEKGYQKNINLMHEEGAAVPGITIFQSFISDEARGIPGMQGMPDGTWFLGAKVNNDEAWQQVKTEKLRGWSIEGIFKYKPIEVSAADIFKQIEALLSQF